MDADKLHEVLIQHRKWLNDEDGGLQADLRGANLRGANLREADQIVMIIPLWTVQVNKKMTRIGCQYHPNDRWQKFTDAQIAAMDSQTADWWKLHKPIVMAAIEQAKELPEYKEHNNG